MKTKIIISLSVLLLFFSDSFAFNITTPDEIKQGEVMLIRIKDHNNSLPEGSILGKKLIFFRDLSGDFISLFGIDMKAPVGEHALKLKIADNTIEKKISIISGLFVVQELTLPKNMVELDPETLKRVEAEAAKLSRLWPLTNKKIWEEGFIMPLQGDVISQFGARRILNGKEKSPHGGIDLRAKQGTPVSAPNNGRIALIDEQYFGGKTVVIDHGYGIYSMFFHLSKISVSQDQKVKKGELIGLVGSTGRSTGPHLHWGVRLQGQRINPLSLVNLEL